MLLAFAAGLGGGNFSSFMPSTSLFFPKRLAGTALAIQAGIGNFGVSVVQFVTPWIIGLSLAADAGRGPDLHRAANGATRTLWLQNAAAIYVPLIAARRRGGLDLPALRAGAGQLSASSSTSSASSTA